MQNGSEKSEPRSIRGDSARKGSSHKTKNEKRSTTVNNGQRASSITKDKSSSQLEKDSFYSNFSWEDFEFEGDSKSARKSFAKQNTKESVTKESVTKNAKEDVTKNTVTKNAAKKSFSRDSGKKETGTKKIGTRVSFADDKKTLADDRNLAYFNADFSSDFEDEFNNSAFQKLVSKPIIVASNSPELDNTKTSSSTKVCKCPSGNKCSCSSELSQPPTIGEAVSRVFAGSHNKNRRSKSDSDSTRFQNKKILSGVNDENCRHREFLHCENGRKRERGKSCITNTKKSKEKSSVERPPRPASRKFGESGKKLSIKLAKRTKKKLKSKPDLIDLTDTQPLNKPTVLLVPKKQADIIDLTKPLIMSNFIEPKNIKTEPIDLAAPNSQLNSELNSEPNGEPNGEPNRKSVGEPVGGPVGELDIKTEPYDDDFTPNENTSRDMDIDFAGRTTQSHSDYKSDSVTKSDNILDKS